jgi:hypothetical protein
METTRAERPIVMKKNLLLAMISSLIALFTIELALRTNLIPNEFYLKMKESVPQGETKGRLLILGDSFAAAWNSEERLTDMLERRLLEKNFRILNLARGGYGPFEYTSQLKTFGLAFRPDLVLLFYYAGNDLTDVQYAMKKRESSPSRTKLQNAFRPYLHHVYLYHYYKEFEAALHDYRMKDWSKFEQEGFPEEILTLVKERKINYNFLSKSRSTEHFMSNALMETEENMRAWDTCVALFDEIHGLCRERGSTLVIVVLPFSAQVNDHQFWLFEGMKFTIDERMLTEQPPQDLMRAYCEDRGIPCLDLLPSFRERRDEDFFRPTDPHFNDEGDKLAAELVYRFLEEHGHLDGR